MTNESAIDEFARRIQADTAEGIGAQALATMWSDQAGYSDDEDIETAVTTMAVVLNALTSHGFTIRRALKGEA